MSESDEAWKLLREVQIALKILHYPAMYDLLQRINVLFGDPVEKRR
jgi:hypothetical protein